MTTALKIRQLASRNSFQADTLTEDSEEDHLIGLELCGPLTSGLVCGRNAMGVSRVLG